MKFLADMGVSMSTTRSLRENGHDVVHLREAGLIRLPDSAVLDKAGNEEQIVLTFDLDFGDLLATGAQQMPSVVIFRIHDQTPSSVTLRLLKVLSECHQELISGSIVVVEDARYRIRRLPIKLDR